MALGQAVPAVVKRVARDAALLLFRQVEHDSTSVGRALQKHAFRSMSSSYCCCDIVSPSVVSPVLVKVHDGIDTRCTGRRICENQHPPAGPSGGTDLAIVDG
jgi:hypothetical protein